MCGWVGLGIRGICVNSCTVNEGAVIKEKKDSPPRLRADAFQFDFNMLV